MVVLTLLSMLPQLVLPSPNVTLVFWDMMLGLKFLLCVEMVEKYERLMGGGVTNYPVGEAEERGYLVLLWQPPPNVFHAKEK